MIFSNSHHDKFLVFWFVASTRPVNTYSDVFRPLVTLCFFRLSTQWLIGIGLVGLRTAHITATGKRDLRPYRPRGSSTQRIRRLGRENNAE
jgi:hypothetical protein